MPVTTRKKLQKIEHQKLNAKRKAGWKKKTFSRQKEGIDGEGEFKKTNPSFQEKLPVSSRSQVVPCKKSIELPRQKKLYEIHQTAI